MTNLPVVFEKHVGKHETYYEIIIQGTRVGTWYSDESLLWLNHVSFENMIEKAIKTQFNTKPEEIEYE